MNYEIDTAIFLEISHKFHSMLDNKEIVDGFSLGMGVICTMIDILAEYYGLDALSLADTIANAVVSQHLEKPELYSEDI